MSVEFRPRKMSEYLRSARRRKWLILLPTIAIGLAIAYVVFRLPDVYESSTLIVVKPSTLPNSVVPTISEETLTRELTSISQVVTSRSSLQPLMEKYDLFKEERLRGEPTELLIDQMRKQIKVEVNTSRNDITNGFNITYRGRDPKSTQAVAGELASRYRTRHHRHPTPELFAAEHEQPAVAIAGARWAFDCSARSAKSADCRTGTLA